MGMGFFLLSLEKSMARVNSVIDSVSETISVSSALPLSEKSRDPVDFVIESLSDCASMPLLLLEGFVALVDFVLDSESDPLPMSWPLLALVDFALDSVSDSNLTSMPVSGFIEFAPTAHCNSPLTPSRTGTDANRIITVSLHPSSVLISCASLYVDVRD